MNPQYRPVRDRIVEKQEMEDRVINALAAGALGGAVLAFLIVTIKWLVRGAKSLAEKAEQNAPEIKQRLKVAATASAEQAAKFTQSAGEKLRATREAIRDSQAGRMPKYEQLEKLGELRDKGVLTDEEFQVEKTRILNG